MIFFLFIYKLLSNGIYFLRTLLFKRKYHNWLLFDKDIPMATYKSTLKSILKKADVSDSVVPYAQPVGYGHIATGSTSVLNNFPNKLEDHAAMTSKMIDEAIGVYRQRFLETFNPLYWIDSIIYLPRTTLSYLGLSPDSVLVKLLNIVWWIVGPFAILFRENLIDFILDLFSSTK